MLLLGFCVAAASAEAETNAAAYRDKFLPTYASRARAASCSASGAAFALGIVTSPTNFRHREAIRKTWLRLPNAYNSTLVHKFFVGVQKNGSSFPGIEREAVTHGDIVELGCVEGYENIKYKAVAIFRWGVRECGARFVLTSRPIHVASDSMAFPHCSPLSHPTIAALQVSKSGS